MPTKVTSHTAGSWFPSGYYGHYRSRVRVDFNNEYRQIARPQPPERFLQRSIRPASTHQFSIHDNRHSFMNDASYFAQGLGKKRHPERSGLFDPNFVAWCPNKINAKSGRPLTSTYRTDFHKNQSNLQLLTQRPKTSFEQSSTTTYRTAHGCDSPNRDFINAMNNEALMLSAQSRQRQAKLKKSSCRETVASCLSWYKPRIPAATGITDYDHIGMKPAEATDLNMCQATTTTATPSAAAGEQVSSNHVASHPQMVHVPHPPPTQPPVIVCEQQPQQSMVADCCGE